jgi:hypothetical protein
MALVTSSRSKPLPYIVQNRHRFPLNPIYELRLRARLQLRPTNDLVRPQFTSQQYNWGYTAAEGVAKAWGNEKLAPRG